MIDKKAAKLSLSAVLLLVLTAVVSTFGCSDDNGGGKVKPAKEWDHSFYKTVLDKGCRKQVECEITNKQNQKITKEYCDAQLAEFDTEEVKTGFNQQMKELASCKGNLTCCTPKQVMCLTACMNENISCQAMRGDKAAVEAEADGLLKCVNSCTADDSCQEWKRADLDKKDD